MARTPSGPRHPTAGIDHLGARSRRRHERPVEPRRRAGARGRGRRARHGRRTSGDAAQQRGQARGPGRRPEPLHRCRRHQTWRAPASDARPRARPRYRRPAVPPASATASSAPAGSRPLRATITASAPGGAAGSQRLTVPPPPDDLRRRRRGPGEGPGSRRPGATERTRPVRKVRHSSSSGSWWTEQTTQSQTRCLVGSGRMVLEGEHHRLGAVVSAARATPIGTRSTLWTMPLAWAFTFQSLHVEGDAEVLADHHRVGHDLDPAAAVGQQLGGRRRLMEAELVDDDHAGPADRPGPRARLARRPPADRSPAHHGRAGRAPVATMTASGVSARDLAGGAPRPRCGARRPRGGRPR